MKVSKEFKKAGKLVNTINRAKDEAKTIISNIKVERSELDKLEETAKYIQKL